ncbi:DNA topoisomerase 2, partial [Massospora cicadina]
TQPNGEDLTKSLVFEQVSKRWEQVSFFNSITTFKGGTPVSHVLDEIVKLLQEELDKKKLKSKILPGAIKSNMWIFDNWMIENPSFDSQTNFGSCFELTEKFQAGVLKSRIINMLTALSQAKDNMAMGILKLENANKAGTQ